MKLDPATDRGTIVSTATRGSIGGVLMGFANLVPGISGGTMLLAAGVYTRFIQAVAEVTTFRFRHRSILLLVSIAIGAALVIVLLAGPVSDLVTTQRWVMYSLFIGLTLGGVPLVWRMVRPATSSAYAGAVVGFAAMALMAFARTAGGGEGNPVLLGVAGIAGASAMILPGVSGAYMLLVLGQYEVILTAIDQAKDGVAGGEFAVVVAAARVLIPVAFGVAVGIVGISNLVRWTLRKLPQATLGVLLGLLFGSVLGIWPFQHAVEHGQPRAFYAPGLAQALVSLGLVAVGLGVTLAIDRLGGGAGNARSRKPA